MKWRKGEREDARDSIAVQVRAASSCCKTRQAAACRKWRTLGREVLWRVSGVLCGMRLA